MIGLYIKAFGFWTFMLFRLNPDVCVIISLWLAALIFGTLLLLCISTL